jgi:hypothetical protein
MTTLAETKPVLAIEPADDSVFEMAEDTVWQRFFYAGKHGYFMQTDDDKFIPLDCGSVRMHLKLLGVHRDNVQGALSKIQHGFVDRVGPLAGYKIGLHSCPDSGGKILVTVPPTIIEAKPGDWPLIRRIMDGLFEDEDWPDQYSFVIAWLKQARENVVRGERRPLPALALVGPPNSGKTLFLEIARFSLGGRAAPAYTALTSDKGFNDEILAAELLTIDDEIVSSLPNARDKLGSAIKTTLYGAAIRIEGKNRGAFPARPVHALAMALNEEPGNVQVLPEIDTHLRDKLALVHTGYAKFADGEAEKRKELWGRIMTELPAFLSFVEGFIIPEHLREARSGVVALQHPRILEILDSIAPEMRLLELLSKCWVVVAAVKEHGIWRGPSTELHNALLSDNDTGMVARSLLSGWTGKLGSWLGRLASAGTYGVKKDAMVRGIQRWTITLPEPEGGWPKERITFYTNSG